MDHLIAALGRQFAIKDLGLLHFFLGAHAIQNSAGMLLSQKYYVSNMLVKTKMDGAASCATPIASSTSVVNSSPFEDPVLYKSTVGALQYATITRPDISYVVNKACQQFILVSCQEDIKVFERHCLLWF
ncbi:uncharacterized protein LOC113346004 [Papaver somniferum]|uniref:uncharacterized protein LOC113346004 n=1 Tax=Papaver somniferum TaxID=3469 RepID=UPI000E6F720F|nr:uncharacterized protein LOC113346004 [Papaver somniferum]